MNLFSILNFRIFTILPTRQNSLRLHLNSRLQISQPDSLCRRNKNIRPHPARNLLLKLLHINQITLIKNINQLLTLFINILLSLQIPRLLNKPRIQNLQNNIRNPHNILHYIRKLPPLLLNILNPTSMPTSKTISYSYHSEPSHQVFLNQPKIYIPFIFPCKYLKYSSG